MCIHKCVCVCTHIPKLIYTHSMYIIIEVIFRAKDIAMKSSAFRGGPESSESHLKEAQNMGP